MELRKDYIMSISDIIDDRNISVLNLYGETGIGKTYLINQLITDHVTKHKIIGGLIDISRFNGMSNKAVSENMYAICDLLRSCKEFKPLRFCVADAIDSKRNNRTSYLQRSAPNEDETSQLETLSDIGELSSIFFDLSSLNNILTLWGMAKKYYNKYKPQTGLERKLYKEYDELDDKALHDMLPQVLAEDLNACEITDDKRIVIFVDNLNSTDLLNENWLDIVINKARDVLWVLVSRNKLDITHPRVQYKLLDGVPTDVMNLYLQENNILDESHRNRIISVCNGSPFYANKLLEVAGSDKDISDSEWKNLEQQGFNGLAQTFIERLNSENKELMYMLTNASEFDNHTFGSLFPERIFNLNKEWFDSNIFERTGCGFYRVQNSTKELITSYLSNKNPNIVSECTRKLFEAEFRLLKKYVELPTGYSRNVIVRHLSCLCQYALELNNHEQFYNALIQLKNVFISHGEIMQYYEHMQYIADKCGENKNLRINATLELAILDYLRGFYRNAARHALDGYELSREAGDGLRALKFLTIRIDIAEISPVDTSNAADQVITLAEEYINLLEELRTSLPYRQYISNRTSAHIYAAKAYTVKENNEKAYEYLDYIFDICRDERKMNSLSLYGICARAYEVKGNMHGANRSDEETEEILRTAVELYDIAEAEQITWDTEFQINCARAHKRLAENQMKLGNFENGIHFCDNALSRYELIKKKEPENTAIYCSICFTLSDCAQYMVNNSKYENAATEYLDRAIATADEAIALLNTGYNNNPNGNRQLCNIKGSAYRTRAIIQENHNNNSEAERLYKLALEAAEASIATAPTHPYGYSGYARTAYRYAKFLKATSRYEEARRIAAAGIENVIESRKYTDNPDSFSDLYNNLNEI